MQSLDIPSSRNYRFNIGGSVRSFYRPIKGFTVAVPLDPAVIGNGSNFRLYPAHKVNYVTLCGNLVFPFNLFIGQVSFFIGVVKCFSKLDSSV